jgi:[protein-PII] uridylyltransferase
VRLHDARIATIGERAEDYFYITDFADQPILDEVVRERLRASIVTELNA